VIELLLDVPQLQGGPIVIWKNLRDYARVFDANRALIDAIRLGSLDMG